MACLPLQSLFTASFLYIPMREFMKTEGCRRLAFHHFDPDAHSCASTVDTLLCDNCERLKKSKGVIKQAFWLRDPPTSSLHSAGPSLGIPPLNPVHLAEQPSSVKSVAAVINHKYATGVKELRVLKHILDTVKTVGCVYCWVKE